MSKRSILLCLVLALLSVAAPAQAAEPTWSERMADALDRARDQGEVLAQRAEQAIVAGGVLVYRHRHTIAGATLGCLAGADGRCHLGARRKRCDRRRCGSRRRPGGGARLRARRARRRRHGPRAGRRLRPAVRHAAGSYFG